jgi:putative transcriptional regulator
VNNRVRELREAKGLTQGELGQALRPTVSRATINAIERGRHEPSLGLAQRIARFFHLSTDEVFLHDDSD